MTTFVTARFEGTEYVTYEGKFVAKFKNGGRGSFLTFLIKNFTVEEYFTRLLAGESPSRILQSKGYTGP